MDKETKKTGLFGDEWGTNEWFKTLLRTQGDEDPSAYYGHRSNGYQRRRHRVIASLLGRNHSELNGAALLDIGCGAGDLTATVAESVRASQVLGIDFVEGVIEKARAKYPKWEFEVGQLMDVSRESESFDLIIASEVLYYLEPEVRQQWLVEIRRLLRPGGMLLFASALGGRYFSIESAKLLLSEHFEIGTIKVEYYKLYHLITSPLQQIRILGMYLRSGEEPGSASSRTRYRKIVKYLRIPGIRGILGIIGWFGGLILRSSLLPSAIERLTAIFLPLRRNATNIVVVAVKAKTVKIS